MGIYEMTADSLGGETVALNEFAGKILLVVNTASKCGFTPQYKGLESLYQQYKDKGLVILGFPCNQFGGQEPGDAEEIGEFCERNFGVTFPLFAKVDVNGSDAHPLFNYLKDEAPGLLGSKKIKWNFTKFLVGRDGKVIKRFAPTDTPAAIEKTLQQLL
ncbi:MAG: glutathione peroxidase [Gammaproteobacteria bacterium]|nr:glutathione peroxidase [Gammaproteobacteria bacterium]